MTADESLLKSRLKRLYPEQATTLAREIRALLEEYRRPLARSDASGELWSERDVALITYADQLRSDDASPLATFADWLRSAAMDDLFSVVHLLPFFPYTSDDGFSVVDYLAVDPGSGDWDDVARLGAQTDLMFDLVLNHVSSRSAWFQRYLDGAAPFDAFFLEADPAEDLSEVVRPRSSPLLTPFATNRGQRHVWTTFSDDQIDLNFAEPKVLLEMLRVALEYARRGARIIRLDAVGFLWKTPGTNCLHLPETHEVVKLIRDVLGEAFPGTLILTETNVPHAENVSYFGDGDEAHMVYQFSLPPLMLDAFVNEDATYLRRWMQDLAPPPPGCTFFNFTASHDGIGVRPLEGLVPDERFDRIIQAMRERGALVNTRRRADGSDAPYELNITYVDALRPEPLDEPADVERHARRFLTSQAIMLAMPGVPAVYFNSLIGAQNDMQGVQASGVNRRINRKKHDVHELDKELRRAGSLSQTIYSGYRRLLKARRRPAFHPDAPIRHLDTTPDDVLAFCRSSRDGAEQVLIAANFGRQEVVLSPAQLTGAPSGAPFCNLVTGETSERPLLPPGGFVWLQRA